MRPSMSGAAAQLVRALVARTGLARDRVFIGQIRSVDWQSLTFTGERHEIWLRLTGPGAADALAALRDGLAEAEWSLSDQLVADIALVADTVEPDGSISIRLEALTLFD